MLIALSWIGRLSWPLLGSLLPGMSPRFVMIIAAALAVLVAVGGPAGAVWLHMRGEVKIAHNTEKAACEVRFANMQAAAERTIADILAEAGEHQGPKSSVEVVALCRSQPTLCRDGDAK